MIETTQADGPMSVVARLVTLVDLRDNDLGGQMSFSARHEAVLEDCRHLLLLDDRGWSSSFLRTTADSDSPRDVPDFWATTSREDIEETARFVVGPDEPFDGRSQEDMEGDHWAYLSGILRQQGVATDADELKGLPHDVVLSERVLALLGGDPEAPGTPG
jgi:hypothetical protein